jgi:hypothetical protein
MLLSLLALAVALSALCISRRLDEVTSLLFNLIGLFSLLLSLVYSPWFIKLWLGATVLATSSCAHQHNLRQTRCASFCIARSSCPRLPL